MTLHSILSLYSAEVTRAIYLIINYLTQILKFIVNKLFHQITCFAFQKKEKYILYDFISIYINLKL